MSIGPVLLRDAAEVVQNVTLCPKLIFNDFDATGNLLVLIQKIQKVIGVFKQIAPLELISKGVSPIANFIFAIDIPRCFYDLGAAAKKEPLMDCANILNIAKTVCTLVQEMICSLWWLVSVKILGEWVSTGTAKICLSNRRFVVLDGVCDLATVVGSTFSIADSVRLMAQEGNSGPQRTIAGLKVSTKLFGRCLGVATDVCMIASAVLGNIPSISVAYSAAAAGVGLVISLGKFLDGKSQAAAAA